MDTRGGWLTGLLTLGLAVPALAQSVGAAPRGRFGTSLSYLAGVGDEPVGYDGLVLDAGYVLLDTLALAVSVGFLHGAYSEIVAGAGGIIEHKMAGQNGCIQNPVNCANINPILPDTTFVTGMADLVAIWSPIYIDALEPLNGSLELFGLVGGGINGTRAVEARAKPNPTRPTDYIVDGAGFGEGGSFGDLEPHLTVGAGLRAIVWQLLAVQLGFRTLSFHRRFDFGEGETGYWGTLWFAQIGVGLAVQP